MRFLTNIYDPQLPDAKIMHIAIRGMSKDESWKMHIKWLSDKIIGEPAPTDYYTVEELINGKIVGVYDPE